MKIPFTSFQIDVTCVGSQGCWHETHYRLKQMHLRFTKEQIEALERDGYFGCGQELRFDLASQEEIDSGDGINKYFQIGVRRICDSSD